MSLLVDGFYAATILSKEDPVAYDTLRTTPVPTHASGNEDISIQPAYAFPVLSHNPRTDELMQVRWNNDDRARFKNLSAEKLDEWYDAARKWVAILKRPEMEYWAQLKPGMPLSKTEEHTCRVYYLIGMQSLIIGEYCMEGLLSLGNEGCVVAIVSLYK